MFYLDFMLIIYQIFKTNASIEMHMKANKVGFSTLSTLNLNHRLKNMILACLHLIKSLDNHIYRFNLRSLRFGPLDQFRANLDRPTKQAHKQTINHKPYHTST